MPQLPSLERWALLPFGGFPTLTCLLFFWTCYFLGTCIIFFSQQVLGLYLGLFLFYRCFSVPYFGLAWRARCISLPPQPMIYRQIFARKSCRKNQDFCTRLCSHKNRPKGGGNSFDFIFFFFYLLCWYYFYIAYFVCAPASEFGAMGSTSFLEFSYPNLLLVFLKILSEKLRFLYNILFP